MLNFSNLSYLSEIFPEIFPESFRWHIFPEKSHHYQGVTAASIIHVRDGGSRRRTNTVILTFASPQPPKYITASYLRVPVEPYIPNPLRCFNCQKYGHSSRACKSTALCVHCGESGHEAAHCKNKKKVCQLQRRPLCLLTRMSQVELGKKSTANKSGARYLVSRCQKDCPFWAVGEYLLQKNSSFSRFFRHHQNNPTDSEKDNINLHTNRTHLARGNRFPCPSET